MPQSSESNSNLISVRRLYAALVSLWSNMRNALTYKADATTVEALSSRMGTAESDITTIGTDVHNLRTQIIPNIAQGVSTKQNQTDNSLNTSSKTVVGAINELKTQYSQSDVRLFMTGKDLFIICPEGFIQQDDEIIFARYISTKHAQKFLDEDNSTQHLRQKVKGWIRPFWYKYNTDSRMYFHERMFTIVKEQVYQPEITVVDEESSNEFPYLPYTHDKCDYWRLFIEGEETNFADDLYIANGETLTGESGVKGARWSINLHKKLGVCVTRDGAAITPYLPFGIVFVEDKQEVFLSRK